MIPLARFDRFFWRERLMPSYGTVIGSYGVDAPCVSPYSRPNVLFELGDTATTSHNVEVKPGEAWVIQGQGLTDDDCLAVEVVSGCGVGDLFTPYSLGCGCPVTICGDRQRVVLPYPGRYRVTVSRGTPGLYRVTAYVTHDNTVSPTGASMGCGCNDSPVQVIAQITTDANAMLLLCNALKPCIQANANALTADDIANALKDDTTALATLCVALQPCILSVIEDLPDRLVASIFDDVSARAALCAGLASCIDDRINSALPTIIVSPPIVTALCSALQACIDTRINNNTNNIINNIINNAPALAALCAALGPCIDARIAAGGGGGTMTGPQIVAAIGASPAAIASLCTVMTPCIDARVDQGFLDSTGAFYVAKITGSAAALADLCTALIPCIQANVPGGGGGGLTSVARNAPLTGNGTPANPLDIDFSTMDPTDIRAIVDAIQGDAIAFDDLRTSLAGAIMLSDSASAAGLGTTAPGAPFVFPATIKSRDLGANTRLEFVTTAAGLGGAPLELEMSINGGASWIALGINTFGAGTNIAGLTQYSLAVPIDHTFGGGAPTFRVSAGSTPSALYSESTNVRFRLVTPGGGALSTVYRATVMAA